MLSNLSRRSFSLAATKLAVGGCLAARGEFLLADEEDFEVGRHLYKSLKWNMVRLQGSILEKFSGLKEIGFDGVELDSLGDVDAMEARAASEAAGLPIEGIVNPTHWKIRYSDPDPKIRQQAHDNMVRALEFASKVGATSVLLVPGNVTNPENENHDQVWERSLAGIRKTIPLAHRLKVQILIENVGNGFCETPELFAEYIDTIADEYVGIHFDIGNHIRVGPPADWIRILGVRIKKFDVKDRTRQNERTLIGEGDADWPAVRRAIRQLGYRGWAAAEVPGGDRERLADVLARMNRVLGKSDGNPASLTPARAG